MDKHKVIKGQFFTKEHIWLKKQIIEFIKNSKCDIAYDPFAGAGDLIKCSKIYGIDKCKGLDIDDKLGWNKNDSLINIPHVDNAIIITNPPYLSNYSASRKKVFEDVKKYFDSSAYDDLYLIALDRMLEAQDYVVAIIPETFINSNFKQFNRLFSVTILEENPFVDTDTPVCVACFDNKIKKLNSVLIYKNDEFINDFQSLNSLRIKSMNDVVLKFNDIHGWLALRAVDTTNPNDMIRFDFKNNIDYDWNNGIKVSSRLLSLIQIDVKDEDKKKYIDECNSILYKIRNISKDLILSPFKGNMKNGVRRRRLDFATARAIMELAYKRIYGGTLF